MPLVVGAEALFFLIYLLQGLQDVITKGMSPDRTIHFLIDSNDAGPVQVSEGVVNPFLTLT